MGGGRVILLAVPASARRTIVAWTLYDFANSAFAAVVLSTVYPAYYANVVVGTADRAARADRPRVSGGVRGRLRGLARGVRGRVPVRGRPRVRGLLRGRGRPLRRLLDPRLRHLARRRAPPDAARDGGDAWRRRDAGDPAREPARSGH